MSRETPVLFLRVRVATDLWKNFQKSKRFPFVRV